MAFNLISLLNEGPGFHVSVDGIAACFPSAIASMRFVPLIASPCEIWIVALSVKESTFMVPTRLRAGHSGVSRPICFLPQGCDHGVHFEYKLEPGTGSGLRRPLSSAPSKSFLHI